MSVLEYRGEVHDEQEQCVRWVAAVALARGRDLSQEKLDQAVVLLKRIEWGGTQGDEDCPECHGWRFDGHNPGCDLAALIGK